MTNVRIPNSGYSKTRTASSRPHFKLTIEGREIDIYTREARADTAAGNVRQILDLQVAHGDGNALRTLKLEVVEFIAAVGGRKISAAFESEAKQLSEQLHRQLLNLNQDNARTAMEDAMALVRISLLKDMTEYARTLGDGFREFVVALPTPTVERIEYFSNAAIGKSASEGQKLADNYIHLIDEQWAQEGKINLERIRHAAGKILRLLG